MPYWAYESLIIAAHDALELALVSRELDHAHVEGLAVRGVAWRGVAWRGVAWRACVRACVRALLL